MDNGGESGEGSAKNPSQDNFISRKMRKDYKVIWQNNRKRQEDEEGGW